MRPNKMDQTTVSAETRRVSYPRGDEATSLGIQAISPNFVRRDDRGTFAEIIATGPWEAVIHGSMREGAVLGNHYHERTRMFFYLIMGSAEIHWIEINSHQYGLTMVSSEEGAILEPNVAHAIRFIVHSSFLLLKSLAHDPENPDTFAHQVLPSMGEHSAVS